MSSGSPDAARGLRWWLRNYPWGDEFGNAFGWSQENPRRLWFHLPFVGEFRVYRWGVELNLGPVLCFVALGFGTLGISARLVRGVW